MNNNPIQVVLNPKDYTHSPDRPPGGSKFDFYGGNDKEFIEHKENIQRQIDYISSSTLEANEEVSIIKVELKPQALAKSHRPTNALFPSDKSPQIGGLGIGQLLFQVTQSSLSWLKQKVVKTENESNLIYERDKWVYKPSAARSELGAIEKITKYSENDKFDFSFYDDAILHMENVGVSGYIVELNQFKNPSNRKYHFPEHYVSKLKNQLKKQLYMLGSGVVLSKFIGSEKDSSLLFVRLYNPSACETVIDFDRAVRVGKLIGRNDLNDFDESRHELLIQILRKSALVKKVSLPPALSKEKSKVESSREIIEIPHRDDKSNYNFPKLGVIDSGINSNELSSWVVGVSNGFDPEECDPNHGTQVASLVVGGKTLNPDVPGIEKDGCLLYDIWVPIHPDKNSFFQYFDNYGDFFDWLDYEVGVAVRNGIRIFNFSINFVEFVRDDKYSLTASQIDRISRKHGVIFVVSAGNLGPIDYRPRWPSESALFSDIDRIYQPSESVTAVTVGAINPPGCNQNIFGAPAVYSRRGPSVAMGVKPDVVHYGGFVRKTYPTSGLNTLNSSEQLVQDRGTSFSAPLISKLLASLDYQTNEKLTRNSLIAVLVHHSETPDPMNNPDVPPSVRRRFVGYGLPSTSESMLLTEDYKITLLFEGNVKKGEEVNFDFDWPDSLVTGGKCKGQATLTIVSDPITNYSYGAEYCRVNVDASLQQETLVNGEWVYRKNCDFIWDTKVGEEPNYEKHLIEHGLKWWPVKKYSRLMKRGVGKSKSWRLRVKATERSPGDYPSDGVDFSVVVSIQDHKKQEMNVFNEVQRRLKLNGVSIQSIHAQQDIKAKVD